MKKVELSFEQAKKSFIQDGINYELYIIFEAGFQNEFNEEGNPEETCSLGMSLEQAKKYVVENTQWHIEQRNNGIFLCGNNDISGFGYGEEKIDKMPII